MLTYSLHVDKLYKKTLNFNVFFKKKKKVFQFFLIHIYVDKLYKKH